MAAHQREQARQLLFAKTPEAGLAAVSAIVAHKVALLDENDDENNKKRRRRETSATPSTLSLDGLKKKTKKQAKPPRGAPTTLRLLAPSPSSPSDEDEEHDL